MKNKLIIITLLAIGVFLLSTCKKDPDLRMPELQKSGVIPQITKDASTDQSISLMDINNFSGAVVVGLYYPDLKPKSFNLMVCMNGITSMTGTLMANVTSFPTNVSFTIADLVNIIPGLDVIDSIKLGDYFKIYADIVLEDGTVVTGSDSITTQSGVKIPFAGYNSNIANLPGCSLNVTYTVVCPFEPSMAVGSYHAYSAPTEWNGSGDVTFTADPDDPYTIYIDGMADGVDFLEANGNPIVIHIDPNTYEITGEPSTIAADCGGWGLPEYTNYTYTATSGTYYSCTGVFKIKFAITVDQGSFGEFNFEFTRN